MVIRKISPTPAVPLLALLFLAAPARAQVLMTDPWVANGQVRAICVSNHVVYLGGDFFEIGPQTGSAAAIDATTGDPLPRFPLAKGKVLAVTPDGSGGWYIGGMFTEVQGQPRNGLARLAPDGHLLPWDPAPSGEPSYNMGISAIVVDGGTVYVGGFFSGIGGQARNNVAALDGSSAAATPWDPDTDGWVGALAVSGGTVYMGGNFTHVGGQVRNHIARVNAATGAVTGWNPDTDGWVGSLAVSGGMVYVAGSFTQVGGQPRNNLAALDASGAVTAWNPGSNGPVLALVVDGATVYAGGEFTMMSSVSRNHLAAIDVNTGLATAWNPNANDRVLSLISSGGLFYAGGDFSLVGGEYRRKLAAIDAGGQATAWDPNPDYRVWSLAASGSVVFAGGEFNGVGARPRRNVAALDAETGALLPWNPDVSGTVHALAADGPYVYVGGSFGGVGGEPHLGLAKVDTAGTVVSSWNPEADRQVQALAVGSGVVYAGGQFTDIDGQPRIFLAALDATSGDVTAWNPTAYGEVTALAIRRDPVFPYSSTLFVGGTFSEMGGGVIRHQVAAIDANGTVLPWNPDADGPVLAIAVVDRTPSEYTVYIGGNFDNVGGHSRESVAAVDAAGAVTSWNPGVNNGCFCCSSPECDYCCTQVSALAVDGNQVFLGGSFVRVGGQTHWNLASVDATSGAVTSWNPSVNGEVSALAASAGMVYAGGEFETVGGHPRRDLAFFNARLTSVDRDRVDPAPGKLRIDPNPFRSSVNMRFTLLTGGNADVVVHDLAGRRVRRLSRGPLAAGEQRVVWDGRDDSGADVKPGLYFVRVQGMGAGLRAKVLRIE